MCSAVHPSLHYCCCNKLVEKYNKKQNRTKREKKEKQKKRRERKEQRERRKLPVDSIDVGVSLEEEVDDVNVPSATRGVKCCLVIPV